ANFKELAAHICPRGTFNFLLSNGQALWSHASTSLYYIERRHPFGQAQLSDEDVRLDFSRETSERDEVAVIVTSPLTTNETWTAFGKGELLVFEQGRRLSL
ncbi:class II glutamine amidotransferase, partial [Acidovorax radicis]